MPSVPAMSTDVDPDMVRDGLGRPTRARPVAGAAPAIRSRTVGLAARFSAALSAGRTSLRSNAAGGLGHRDGADRDQHDEHDEHLEQEVLPRQGHLASSRRRGHGTGWHRRGPCARDHNDHNVR